MRFALAPAEATKVVVTFTRGLAVMERIYDDRDSLVMAADALPKSLVFSPLDADQRKQARDHARRERSGLPGLLVDHDDDSLASTNAPAVLWRRVGAARRNTPIAFGVANPKPALPAEAAVDARVGLFDVLVVEAFDRLSRDMEDLAGIYKRFTFLGIEIRAVYEGQANTVLVGLRGLVGQLYREDNVDKIRRGMTGFGETGTLCWRTRIWLRSRCRRERKTGHC